MKVLVSDQRGKLVKLNDVVAKTLMQAMRDAGLNLTAQCGGVRPAEPVMCMSTILGERNSSLLVKSKMQCWT